MRPGSRTRLCHRLVAHPAGKGKRRSMSERDFIALLDGAHQRELIDAREWLTVFLLPAHSPDLNPVEGVWAHVKPSLANLAVVALDRLEPLSATGSNDSSTARNPRRLHRRHRPRPRQPDLTLTSRSQYS